MKISERHTTYDCIEMERPKTKILLRVLRRALDGHNNVIVNKSEGKVIKELDDNLIDYMK